MITDAVLIAVFTGMASGLVTWGMVKVELRWLRRDVDLAHRRIDELSRALGRTSGRNAPLG